MPEVQIRQTFGIGEGTIGPSSVVERGVATYEEINECLDRIRAGEFITRVEDPLAATKLAEGCVDGRNPRPGMNLAGGTTSYVIADALTGQRYRAAGEQVTAHAERVFKVLVQNEEGIFVHEDDTNVHVHGPSCGCGAEDKLDGEEEGDPSILGYIERRFDDIQGFLHELSVDISIRNQTQIPQRATQLRAEKYATGGAAINAVATKIGGPQTVATYEGSHNEVAAVLLTDPNERFDRGALFDAYGGRIGVFVVTVPAMENGARKLAIDDQEVVDLVEGNATYNVATTAVLGASDLHIIVR